MARSVVLKGTVRCEGCQLAPRWCICEGLRSFACPVQVDVIIHHREQWRPSSTSHLIKRTLTGTRLHVFRREEPLDPAAVIAPGKQLWVLHPLGEPLDHVVAEGRAAAAAGALQVLLLDGSWGEAADMNRATAAWPSRRVNLPMSGKSRYWLRAQQEDGQFSTVEALMFLLAALGLSDARDALALQLELRVYAGLLARGRKIDAANYLLDSPVAKTFPDLVKRLQPSWV